MNLHSSGALPRAVSVAVPTRASQDSREAPCPFPLRHCRRQREEASYALWKASLAYSNLMELAGVQKLE
jgi:hypothetical protein